MARIYKIKKYNFVVTNDLSMMPLDINNKNTFMLIENRSIYLFSLNDLITIIETAISNSPNFFSTPLTPLNPYNNQPFSDSTLYNIYFKMKESGRLISVLFHFYFLENFVKSNFSEHYEPFIREIAIKNYVFNSPYTILHNSIINMLKTNIYTRNYNIDIDFPKDLLVDIFRPFLFYYYIKHYDIKGTNKVVSYAFLLDIKLKAFYLYNPAFGRKYIRVIKNFNNTVSHEYIFNTTHINFYKINCHIYNDYEEYEEYMSTTTSDYNSDSEDELDLDSNT